MKTLKLIRDLCSGVAIASMLIWLFKYVKSPMTFVMPWNLYYVTICAGLLSAILKVIYLILEKNYKGLKRFFINVILGIVLIFVLIYVVD